jgi:hypothetical protein
LNRKLSLLGVLLIAVCIGGFGTGWYYSTHFFRTAELNIDVNVNSLHVTAWIKRAGEENWTFLSHHAATLTTIGKNWIEDQLGDSPSTDPAKWISVSTSASSPSAAWTQIPTEIASGGLTRGVGTYASTGDGTWTITVTFTSTGKPTLRTP